MIPMELGELSWQRIGFYEDQKKLQRRIELDMIQEDRDKALYLFPFPPFFLFYFLLHLHPLHHFFASVSFTVILIFPSFTPLFSLYWCCTHPRAHATKGLMA